MTNGLKTATVYRGLPAHHAIEMGAPIYPEMTTHLILLPLLTSTMTSSGIWKRQLPGLWAGDRSPIETA